MNSEMFQLLNEKMINWKRLTMTQVVVYSNGYVSNECFTIDKIMSDYGMLSVSRKFDSKLGKTANVYKLIEKSKYV